MEQLSRNFNSKNAQNQVKRESKQILEPNIMHLNLLKTKPSNRGFNLLEAMIASFLALSVSIAFSTALITQLKAVSEGRNRLAAQYLLDRCLSTAVEVPEEDIENMPIILATEAGGGLLYTIEDRNAGNVTENNYTMWLEVDENPDSYTFTSRVEWNSGEGTRDIEGTYVRLKQAE